jgi:Icc-related predicted phosphoesterase
MKELKIWHIGDTHTFHELLEIPKDIDLVIFSGDCSNPRDPYKNELEVRNFIEWFGALPIKHKVFVAGNHDGSIEKGLVKKIDFANNTIHYLENTHITIEGVKIFGSPYTPRFGDWSFMKQRNKMDAMWRNVIDEDTNIIVVHGPPKGILDLSYDRDNKLEHCGDKSLWNAIVKINPELMLFGHIHNNKDIINAGVRTVPNLKTTFSNGSVVKDREFGMLSSNGNMLTIMQQ